MLCNGDGSLATSAQLNAPNGVVATQSGEVYIVDTDNHRIRKVLTNGTIYTIAGTGVSGFSGDGGQATSAQLNGPSAVRLSPNGELYIADSNNHRIRKIDINGTITTIAGDGTAGLGGDGGPATSAQLKNPYEIVFSSNGELYFADSGNQRIRKIALGGTISTFAGSSGGYSGDGGQATSAQLNYPYALSLSSNGELYIADSNNHRIRKVDSNGVISTIAGSGPIGGGAYSGDGGLATSAEFHQPCGIVVNSIGEVYISDTGNNRIRKISLNGTISTIIGDGTNGFGGDGGDPLQAQLKFPNSFDLVNGKFYIADTRNHRIREVKEKLTCNGTLSTDANVCSGHGTCTHTDVCTCNAKYYGSNCEIPTCNGKLPNDTQVCGGHGTCTNVDECVCNSNYFGLNCQVTRCNGILSNTTLVCNGNGQCTQTDRCQCESGWYGNDCSISMCFGILANSSHSCNETGECVGVDTCICNQGFTGSKCDVPLCFGKLANDTLNVCSGNGQCTSNNTCQCSNSWTGVSCSIAPCFTIPQNDPTVCSSRGSCIGIDSCQCIDGWAGSKCDIPLCFGKLANDTLNVCSGNGQCTSNNTCQCSNSWTGVSCSIAPCFTIPQNDPTVCSSRGSCIGIDSCQCIDGWTGSKCDQFTCFGLLPSNGAVCNFGKGTCMSNNTCSCLNNGWIGERCEIATCFNIASNDPHVHVLELMNVFVHLDGRESNVHVHHNSIVLLMVIVI